MSRVDAFAPTSSGARPTKIGSGGFQLRAGFHRLPDVQHREPWRVLGRRRRLTLTSRQVLRSLHGCEAVHHRRAGRRDWVDRPNVASLRPHRPPAAHRSLPVGLPPLWQRGRSTPVPHPGVASARAQPEGHRRRVGWGLGRPTPSDRPTPGRGAAAGGAEPIPRAQAATPSRPGRPTPRPDQRAVHRRNGDHRVIHPPVLRQGPRHLRRRRRSSAVRRLGPHVGLRRRDGRARARQGPRAHGHDRVLARPAGRPRPQPPRLPRRGRLPGRCGRERARRGGGAEGPVDARAQGRDAADRVHRAGLPHRLGVEGVHVERDDARRLAARRAAGVVQAARAGVHPIDQGGRPATTRTSRSRPPATSSAPTWPRRLASCRWPPTSGARRWRPSAGSSSPTPSSSSG